MRETWAGHKYSTSKVGQKVEMIVLAQKVCELFEPLYKLLRIVDTEVYPTIGTVYELMRIVKE